MLNLESILLILIVMFAHTIADFIFQAEKWAVNKRNSFTALLKHTLTYSTVMTILLFIPFFWTIKTTLLFWIITFATHTLVDKYTSKIIGRKFDKKEFGSAIPNFGAFTIIQFDQMLHYICLFLTVLFL